MKEILDHKVQIKYLDECFAESTLDIKLETENCKTANTLCSNGWTNIRQEPIFNYVLVTKALFLESAETGDKQHTAQFVADELEEVAKVWCPAMIRDRNAMIWIDTICLDNPRVNKLATSLLKQKYPHLQTIGCIPHILNLLVQDTMKCLDQCFNNIFKVITFVRSHHMAQFVLNKKQISFLGKTISPKLPIKTRWGSIYQFMCFMKELWEPLWSILINRRCDINEGIQDIRKLLFND
jgi:myosin-crossreactive antigen